MTEGYSILHRTTTYSNLVQSIDRSKQNTSFKDGLIFHLLKTDISTTTQVRVPIEWKNL